MKVITLVAALLSSTLAVPTEDIADKTIPQPARQPQVHKHVQYVKHAHYGHAPVAPPAPGSHNAAPVVQVQQKQAAPAQRPRVQAQRPQVQQRPRVQALAVHRPAAAAVQQAHQAQAQHHNTNFATPGYSNDPYQDKVLKHHNYHRQNHLANTLAWDPALAYTAQLVAQTCVYQHNMQYDPGAGQNIAAGYGPQQIGHIITDLFYNNELPMFGNQWYREPDMTYFEQWGHMTQMCWKATTHVGCATQYCPYGLTNVAGGVPPYFTVCNYKNPGNVATEYAMNLSPPQGAPSIGGNAFD